MFLPVIFASFLVFRAAVCAVEEDDADFALVRFHSPDAMDPLF